MTSSRLRTLQHRDKLRSRLSLAAERPLDVDGDSIFLQVMRQIEAEREAIRAEKSRSEQLQFTFEETP